MIRRLALSVAVGCATLAAPAVAREYSAPIAVTSLEDLYDLADAGEITEEELETLVAMFERPIDLNRADRYVLFDLPELSWTQVDAILAKRAEVQGFTLVEDLRDVEGLDEETYQALKPFVSLQAAATVDEAPLVRGKAQTAVMFEAGFADDLRQTPTPDKLPSGYVVAEADAFDNFSAGVELLWRPLTTPQWDRSTGVLVDTSHDFCDPQGSNACTQDALRLQAAFVSWTYDMWRIIGGTYDVGFGQRLTFDSTSEEFPRGWSQRMTRTKDRDDGAVRPDTNMRGAAVMIDGLDTPIGWLDATAFGSYQDYDLYRDDLWMGGDEAFGDLRCDSDADCPGGYACRENGLCYSSAVFELDPETGDATARTFANPTVQNAYAELVGGGNVTFNFDERTSVGATAYRAHTVFNLPAEARPRFSPGARSPVRLDYGAASVDGKLGLGPVDLMGEIGLSDRGAPAGVARAIYTPIEWAAIDAGVRWYSRDYDNPHARSRSSAFYTQGTRQRNEIGGDLELVLRPITHLKLVTHADFFVKPYIEYRVDDKRVWLEHPTTYLRLRQRASYKVTKHEAASVQLDYNNNDLAENGHGDECQTREALPGILPGVLDQSCGFYESQSDREIEGINLKRAGRGEKVAVKLEVSTRRLFDITIKVTFANDWVDVRALDRGFAHEQYVRLAVSSPLWPGGRAWTAAKYWISSSSENDEYDLTAYVGLSQRFLDGTLDLQAIYGMLGEQRSEGFDLRQFGELRIASRF